MNAAAVKRGWVMAGRDGAREWLERFWLKLTGLDGPCSEAVIDWLRTVSPTPALTARAARILPRRRHRRRDHPGAVALPVQPHELPPAARRGRGDARRRRLRLDQGPEALHQRHQRPRRQAAGLRRPRDHRRRHPRLGLPADPLPGDRDRRPEDRPPRGLLGRRLHRQPGALPAVLPHQGGRHRHRPHQPALPRRAAAHLVGNRDADQRDQLQCFAAARASQHRLRQPADRPRRHRAGSRCATTTSTRSATTG